MAQHQTRTGPITNNAAPFSVEMVQGSHPDRPRLPFKTQHPQPLSQTTHVQAVFAPNMAQGSHPDRSRQLLGVRIPLPILPPFIPLSQNEWAGYHPDRPSLLLAPRIPLPWSQTTHVQAPFSIDMVAGSHPDFSRVMLATRSGWVAVPPDVIDQPLDFIGYHPDASRALFSYKPGWQVFPPEVAVIVPDFQLDFIGYHPDLPVIRLGPRIGLPYSQVNHVSAPFSEEMVVGYWPVMPPRLLLGVRVPLPLLPPEVAPLVAPFSNEMVIGYKPDRAPLALLHRFEVRIFDLSLFDENSAPPRILPVSGLPFSGGPATPPADGRILPTYPLPVDKMPLIPDTIGATLKRILDAIVKRIDSLGMFTRDSLGSILLRVPSDGAKDTQLFSSDRARVKLDGSNVLYGSIELPARTVLHSATVRSADFFVQCDATPGAMSIYLPAANLSTGRIYAIKKVDVTANAVTLVASGSDLIDGASTNVIAAQWNGRVIQSDGLGWLILANI